MITRCSSKYFAVALAVSSFFGSAAMAQSRNAPAMKLVVDETQEARRIAFVHEEISVRPGALSLGYPSWIPGEHGPTGPIENFAALQIHAGKTTLPWVRDPDAIYSIHVQIPAGTDKITVDFDTLLENTISDHQLLLAWNTVVLYPLGVDKKDLMVEPSLLLPAHWTQATSLAITNQTDGRVDLAPVALERLIDSPVLAGNFLRAIPLASVWPAELDVTGDNQSAIDKVDDAQAISLFGNLVDQDRAMFGFRHWEKLHILVSQSAAAPFDGLEHEDSPYNGLDDAELSKKESLQKRGFWLLAHEQSHSWDGKYRRPAELYSRPDYQGPERTSLLWVYEGLNEYIGLLLATRAGFNDAAYMQDYLSTTAAEFATESSRAVTPLVDTATENWVIRTVDGGWSSIRRGQDYYDEGALIWLRADTIIREQTQDRLSLDDFLQSFFGQRDTGPIVVPYTRADVESALSAICPYDWHTFFETRIYQVNSNPPTDGLESAGWRLVYNATPNAIFSQDFGPRPVGYHGWYSIGMTVMKDGEVRDVQPGSPAYDAGLGPHMTIVAVDGRAFSPDAISEAVAQPHDGKISLLVRNFDSVQPHEIKYAGGALYPHLERIPDSHDYLGEILQPRNYPAPH